MNFALIIAKRAAPRHPIEIATCKTPIEGKFCAALDKLLNI
jgi:hypothetical protein